VKKIISCDVGTKFHGFALSDSSRKFVIKSWTKKILNSSSGLICNEASDNDVDLIAIGLPVRMSGGDSDMSIHIKSIAKNLTKKGFEVFFVDERLTTDRSLDTDERNRKSAELILKIALKKKEYQDRLLD
tara:strand:- start:4203 stop:4592 length:390 start_codon:yes stop_codon:yes gene_type:complete